ncbi:MAG TPA: response regulator transcription factor [Xanthobacteraceae bacterium]|nr:response regulator transcription factor [Xanthobacteraceae bacterium]
MSSPIRIAVVDDHPLYREGICQTLTGAEGLEVVAEGSTAAGALKAAQECLPDIILLDLGIPGGGINAAANIAGVCPSVRIIMLTASESEQDVASALQAGARGYILKGSSGPEVIETVRVVYRGEHYVAASLGARLLIKISKRTEAVANDTPRDLTSREGEIIALVSQGMSNKEVARKLKCTERTVKYHMTSIMQKCGVQNRVQAVLKLTRRAS